MSMYGFLIKIFFLLARNRGRCIRSYMNTIECGCAVKRNNKFYYDKHFFGRDRTVAIFYKLTNNCNNKIPRGRPALAANARVCFNITYEV